MGVRPEGFIEPTVVPCRGVPSHGSVEPQAEPPSHSDSRGKQRLVSTHHYISLIREFAESGEDAAEVVYDHRTHRATGIMQSLKRAEAALPRVRSVRVTTRGDRVYLYRVDEPPRVTHAEAIADSVRLIARYDDEMEELRLGLVGGRYTGSDECAARARLIKVEQMWCRESNTLAALREWVEEHGDGAEG